MSEFDRLMSASVRTEDSDTEATLRPRQLKDYVGQEQIKHNLSVYIEAALGRHDALDHILLYGPPGLGKTTLACIVDKINNTRCGHIVTVENPLEYIHQHGTSLVSQR